MAEIIQFPKKERPLRSARSVDLYYCWDVRLNNPLLNSIFRPETSYVERWFLQTQHLLNNEELDHPIIKLLMSADDSTLDLLIDNTKKDLAVQIFFSDTNEARDSAEINIQKLNRWHAKWQCLFNYRKNKL